MARSISIPYRIEPMGFTELSDLCPRCLLPSLIDSSVTLEMGHPDTFLYDMQLVTVRVCTTEGCESGDV